MREPPSKAVALRTRGSQFDFALNSRRTVENGADRARFSCSLCPQPLRSRRRELLKCLEMLRLKTPSSRSKSPNSRAACAKVRPKSGQSRRARRRAQNTRNAHMGSFPSIGQGLAGRRTGALRGVALFTFVNVRQYS